MPRKPAATIEASEPASAAESDTAFSIATPALDELRALLAALEASERNLADDESEHALTLREFEPHLLAADLRDDEQVRELAAGQNRCDLLARRIGLLTARVADLRERLLSRNALAHPELHRLSIANAAHQVELRCAAGEGEALPPGASRREHVLDFKCGDIRLHHETVRIMTPHPGAPSAEADARKYVRNADRILAEIADARARGARPARTDVLPWDMQRALASY